MKKYKKLIISKNSSRNENGKIREQKRKETQKSDNKQRNMKNEILDLNTHYNTHVIRT